MRIVYLLVSRVLFTTVKSSLMLFPSSANLPYGLPIPLIVFTDAPTYKFSFDSQISDRV